MYRSFSIKNFRCFDELTVEGMGRINLIAGKNNVGKTALLEALWVHSGGPDPARALRLSSSRGVSVIEPDEAIGNLFLDFNLSSTIELSAQGSQHGNEFVLSIKAAENPEYETPLTQANFYVDDDSVVAEAQDSKKQVILDYSDESGVKASARGWLAEGPNRSSSWVVKSDREGETVDTMPSVYLQASRRPTLLSEANDFSRLEREARERDVVEILRIIEPRLNRLFVSSMRRRAALYADIGLSQRVPIRLMGEGISHILSLSLAIASAPGGMVLVDEIENGIHYSVMEKVWKAIGDFARHYDVQVFATTHSYECIGAAYRAFESDEEDELRLFRIQRNRDGEYKAVKYDRERLKNVFEFQMEFI